MFERHDEGVHPATFPRRDANGRASWLVPAPAKVRQLRFGNAAEGTPPTLKTLPPPPAVPSAGLGAPSAPPDPPPDADADVVLEAERAGSDAPAPSALPHGPPMPPDELQAALARLAEREEAAAEAAIELAVARRLALAGAEETVLELAVAIAEGLVGNALEHHPDLHDALAREALDALGAGPGGSPARLRASPAAHAALVRTHGGDRFDHLGVPVQVHVDDTLDGFGFVAESDDAMVDARLRARLESVRRALIEERRRHVDEPTTNDPAAGGGEEPR